MQTNHLAEIRKFKTAKSAEIRKCFVNYPLHPKRQQ